MRRLIIALVLALLPLAAVAQTVTLKVNSIWSFTEDQKNVLAATLLRKNALSGNLEAISGQRLALEQMKITYGKPLIVPVSMAATFPGQKSSAMTVWGVRLFHSGAGTGWEMPEHPINVTFGAPIVVPAGQKLSCLYKMPVGDMGELSCTVGVATPPPPPPPPPPPTTASKPGDQSPPLAALIATDGAAWTLVSGQVLRNGVNTNCPYSPNVSYLYVSAATTIRAFDPSHGYVCWTGTAWAGSGC